MIRQVLRGRRFGEVRTVGATHIYISGSECHTAHIDFPPEKRLKASPASLVYMSQGVEMTTSMFGGIAQGFKRLLSGASLMLVEFSYRGEGMGHVVLGPNFYSKLLPVDLKQFGGTIVCGKDSFVVGPEDTSVDVHIIRSFLSMIGGEGVLLQRISGSGTVLIKASGAIHTIDLAEGESYLLHPGALVAYEDSTVSYEVQPVPGAKNAFFGQGLFLVKLTGPGKVIIQSMSETKYARSLHVAAGPDMLDALILSHVLMGGSGDSAATGVGEDINPEESKDGEKDNAEEGEKDNAEEMGTEGEDAGSGLKGEESNSNEETSKWGADEEATGGVDAPSGEESSGIVETIVDFFSDLFKSG